MNLSEDSIKFLEQKAFIRGLERAAEIAYEVADDLECEERSGAQSVRLRLEDEQEKLNTALEGEQYEGGLNIPPES